MVELSYEIHTNNELELMLEGKKPLAVFGDEVSCLPNEDIIPEEKFAPYVENGSFVRFEEVIEGPYSEKLERNTSMKNVFFALNGEEWRIKVMIQLLNGLYNKGGWNETCEGLEGFLLGYTESQRDEWSRRHSNKSKHSDAASCADV